MLSPAELYAAMADWGIAVAGIADHDTLAGYRQLRDDLAAGSLPANGPRLIPAVEINSIADRALIDLGVELEEGELHILGYGFDVDDPAFEQAMDGQRNARKARLEMIIERLRELDLPIDEQIAPAMASERGRGPAAHRTGDGRRRPRGERPGGVRQVDRPQRPRLRAAAGHEVARRRSTRSSAPAGWRCWPTTRRRPSSQHS